MDIEFEQPRKRLAEIVGEEVDRQRAEAAAEADYYAAEEEPAFNPRTGQSNFGSRVAAKIRLAQQQ